MNTRKTMNMDADEILVTSRSIFRRACRHSFERESVQAYLLRDELFVSFRSETPSAEKAVHMKLCLGLADDVIWISDLQVAPASRWRGRGRELVGTAETIAHSLGICRIHLFPLWSARPFWHKMGYSPQAGSVRVLEKDIWIDSDQHSNSIIETEIVATS